jgi:hypothetical protein
MLFNSRQSRNSIFIVDIFETLDSAEVAAAAGFGAGKL